MKRIHYLTLPLFGFMLVAAVLLLVQPARQPTVTAAQECPINMEQRILRAVRACRELDRNTACYGNGSITIGIDPIFDSPSLVFANSGDKLHTEALSFIQTGNTALTAENWGISRLEIQANLLEEQIERTSTAWLFGSATLYNRVVYVPQLSAESQGLLNLRVLPNETADIITQIKLRESVIANGRTEDNQWLRVLVPRTETIAWLGADVVNLNGDINTLEVVTPETPYYRPFQVIELQTGANDSPCAGVPDSGFLLQTPNVGTAAPEIIVDKYKWESYWFVWFEDLDIPETRLIVNGATVRIKGTVFLQAASPDQLTVNVLNGGALVEVDGVSQRVPAGARVTVNAGSLGTAEPFVLADFDALPLDGLGYQFTIPQPLTVEQIAQVVSPQPTPTPLPPDPNLARRCTRTLTQPANVRGGPGDFYEVVSNLSKGDLVRPAYQSTDSEGVVWWQIYTGGWIRSDYVESDGDCDEIPVTTATIDSPEVNNLVLENCESDNGPIRAGQYITITFVDGGWESLGEARQAVRVGPAVIKIGTKKLQVSASEPYLVSAGPPERWYMTFTAYWTAQAGTVEIVGTRRYLELRCNLTVPLGR